MYASKIANGRAAVSAALIISFLLMSFIRNGLWKSPTDIWENAIEKSPDKPRVNYELGRLYGMAGKTDRAFFLMRRAKEKDPAFFDRLLSRAEDYRRRGMLKEAAAEYRRILEQDPNQPVIHNDLGAVLHEQGLLVEAFIEFSTAQRLDPSYAMAYANRGVINVEWNQLDNAIKDYRKAVALEPNSATFHAKLAYAYFKKGMTADALKEYDTALRLDPANERAIKERQEAIRKAKASGIISGKNR